ANLLREAGQPRAVAEIHKHFAGSGGEGPWRQVAQGEEWMLTPRDLPPRTFGICRRTAERPRLDGLLSDECWHTAEAIELRCTGSAEGARDAYGEGLVMFAYDSEFLYVAGTFPRHP